MIVRCGFALFTVLCGVALGENVFTAGSSVRHLTLRYTDEVGKTKVLADHTLTLDASGKIDFVAGGEMRLIGSSQVTSFGTRISGEIVPIDADTDRLAITIELGSPVTSEDARTEVVRTESLALSTVLTTGKEARVNCGGSRWCTLCVGD